MRLVKLTTLIALCLVLSLPAFAGFTTFSQPGDDGYIAGTTNYGGGDGSGNFITSLPPYISFSNPQSENNVPNSWATWGCPPATESCSPNVLWNDGFSSLTISLSSPASIFGFELEPDQFAQEEVMAQFFNGASLVGTVDLFPNGSDGVPRVVRG